MLCLCALNYIKKRWIAKEQMARVKEDDNKVRNVCKEISQAQSKRRKSRKASTRSAVLSLVKRWPSAKQGAQVEKGENEARNVQGVREHLARSLTKKKHGKYAVLVCAH